MPTDSATLLDQVIAEHLTAPVDMLGIGDAKGEYEYLGALRDSYARTVREVSGLGDSSTGKQRILELGSFLGPVSVTLKRMGFDVVAADIPEFHASSALRSLYARDNIRFDAINLRQAELPYDSGSFDVVILCEVLEHLNFNPLPALAQINRVLADGGTLYLGMPNQASFRNRARLLFGRSVHNPISDFFAQLDRRNNMIVGLHWREYTMAETVQLVKSVGFEVVSRSFHPGPRETGNPLRQLLRKLLFIFPPFRPFLVVVARKIATPAHDFMRVDANS